MGVCGRGDDEEEGADLNLCATNLIVHRLAAGGYGSGWLREEVFLVMCTCSQRSPDGGGFPGDVHRLAEGG